MVSLLIITYLEKYVKRFMIFFQQFFWFYAKYIFDCVSKEIEINIGTALDIRQKIACSFWRFLTKEIAI